MPAKPKAVYIYPLQVWLTSAFIGPILWFLWPGISEHSLFTFFDFYRITLLIGFLYSFPSFLLLLLGVAIVDQRPWRIFFKKLVVAGWAIVLAIAPFLFIFNWRDLFLDNSSLVSLGAYLVPLLAAVFLFSWPQGE